MIVRPVTYMGSFYVEAELTVAAIYRRRAGKGCGYAGNKTHARANIRYLVCKNGTSKFTTASDWAEHRKCCSL